MRTVCTEVVFYRLFVADVDEDVVENTCVGVFIHGNEQSALQHVLQQSGCFETNRFSSGIGPGDKQYALFGSEAYVKGDDLLVLLPQRQKKQRVYGVVPFDLPNVLEMG